MKLLEPKFTRNVEKVGITNFTQLKVHNGLKANVYIYLREKPDKSYSKYEVFIAKRRYKGQPLPGGTVELEDREQYPTANAFGFTAKEITSIFQADIAFNEFISRANESDEPTKSQSPKGITAYPPGQWVLSQLSDLNPHLTKSSVYFLVRAEIVRGRVSKCGTKPNVLGRGKPSALYCTTSLLHHENLHT